MPNFQKPLEFPFATLWFRLKSEISQSLHHRCPWPCIVYKHLCLPLQYCKLPAPNSDYPQLLKRIERYFIVLHSFILYTLLCNLLLSLEPTWVHCSTQLVWQFVKDKVLGRVFFNVLYSLHSADQWTTVVHTEHCSSVTWTSVNKALLLDRHRHDWRSNIGKVVTLNLIG